MSLDPVSGLRITVTKTANGQSDYMQVTSLDGWSVNIVLIADRIEVNDERQKPNQKKKGAQP